MQWLLLLCLETSSAGSARVRGESTPWFWLQLLHTNSLDANKALCSADIFIFFPLACNSVTA